MMTLNHGFSGYVCGRVAMPLLRRRSPLDTRAMGWAFFLGAMVPDLDMLSRLIGRHVYFSWAWYGHRQASHSLLGTLAMSLVAALLLYWPLVHRRRRHGAAAAAPQRAIAWLWLAGILWSAALVHIVGDLFTPGMPIPVLWPLETRFGAWSHIGWFSPYLLWLFLATVALDWGGRGMARLRPEIRRWLPAGVWLLYALAAFRWLDFLIVSRYESSAQWLAYQSSLLPADLVAPFAYGVHFLWHWLTA